MSTKFSLNNAEGSIVEIDKPANQVRLFKDPWGRESSGMPDETYDLDTIKNQVSCLQFVQANTTEWEHINKRWGFRSKLLQVISFFVVVPHRVWVTILSISEMGSLRPALSGTLDEACCECF